MFQIQPESPVPIYRQLIDQIRRMVTAGQLRPGDELPSVRELAERHVVNPMTISRAYSQLEAEGLLERQRGKPMRIAAQTGAKADPALALAPLTQTLIHAARQLGLSDTQILQLMQTSLQKAEPDHD